MSNKHLAMPPVWQSFCLFYLLVHSIGQYESRYCTQFKSYKHSCNSVIITLPLFLKNQNILMSNENAPSTKMTISFQRHNILFLQLCLMVLKQFIKLLIGL